MTKMDNFSLNAYRKLQKWQQIIGEHILKAEQKFPELNAKTRDLKIQRPDYKRHQDVCFVI